MFYRIKTKIKNSKVCIKHTLEYRIIVPSRLLIFGFFSNPPPPPFIPTPPPPPLLIFENFKSEIETFSQRLLSFTPKRVKVGWLFPHHLFLSRVKKEEIALPQMFSKTELFSFLKIVTQI